MQQRIVAIREYLGNSNAQSRRGEPRGIFVVIQRKYSEGGLLFGKQFESKCCRGAQRRGNVSTIILYELVGTEWIIWGHSVLYSSEAISADVF